MTALLSDDLTRRGPLRRSFDHSTHEAWEVALDRIELDVMRAEHRLAHGLTLTIDLWDVPVGYGPLPDSLRTKAEEILARQRACLEQMSLALGVTYRQQAVAEAMGRTSPAPGDQAIYVDVAI